MENRSYPFKNEGVSCNPKRNRYFYSKEIKAGERWSFTDLVPFANIGGDSDCCLVAVVKAKCGNLPRLGSEQPFLRLSRRVAFEQKAGTKSVATGPKSPII